MPTHAVTLVLKVRIALAGKKTKQNKNNRQRLLPSKTDYHIISLSLPLMSSKWLRQQTIGTAIEVVNHKKTTAGTDACTEGTGALS